MTVVPSSTMLAERKTAAQEAARASLSVLGMLGVPAVNVDIPSLLGDIRALRAVLVRAGLVTVEEYETITAEETASFLREVVGKFQAAVRSRTTVGGDA